MAPAKFWFCILLIYFSFSNVAVARLSTVQSHPIHNTLDSLKKLNNLAEWLYARIDYSYNHPRQSLPFFMDTEQVIWRKPESAAEKEAWLMLLSNQGYNQMYSGNILKSINCYELAYNYAIDNKLNVEGIAEYVLKPWANNYTRLGDYEKALFIQQKTLEYAKKEHNNPLTVSVYNNMAISYRSLGDFKNAEACILLGYQKARPSDFILLDNTLADTYKDKGELDLAENTIEKNIIRQKRQQPDFETAYWLLSSYITAGDIQLMKNEIRTAQNYYQKALEINQKYYRGNRLREKAYTFIQLGKTKLAQGLGKKSLIDFNQALSSLGLIDAGNHVNSQRIFGDNRLMEVFYQKALAYELMDMKEDALENIRFSLLAADKIRFELADVKTKQRFQAESKQMAEKAIAIAFALLERTKQTRYAEVVLDVIEQSKARTLLDDIRRNQHQLTLSTKDTLFQRKVQIEQAIAYNERELLQGEDDKNDLEGQNAALKFKLDAIEKKLAKNYPSLAINNFNSVKNLLKKIPEEAHFVSFFMGLEKLYIVEIQNKRIKHIKQISGANRLKKTISDFADTYYHHGPMPMMNEPKSFFTASNRIYNTLLGGFNFPKHKKLVVIPDEVIGYLSFDGLITQDNYQPDIAKWPYLIKELSVAYAFSIQTWLDQSAKKSNHDKKFTGLFVTHQNKNRKFIPAVAKEAESIEKIIDGKFMKDKDARVNDFFKAFDQSNVLHISTHSYLSGLQKEPTLAFDDDQVFLFELSARKTAPDLVVLSACRTADGLLNAGEGIISLSRGFAAIGTGGTIAGLWNVNDQAASEITATCYRNILSGQEIGTALHYAKLNWLQSKQRPSQEYLPYYWDALIYMGYDKTIPLNSASSNLIKYGKPFAAILIALTGCFFLFKKRKRPNYPASI